MSEMTTERLATRILDAGIVDARQLDAVFGEFGSREIPLPDFTSVLMRKGLITNFQLERLLKGQ